MARKDKFLRKCISCSSFKSKSELIRIMKSSNDSSVQVNPNGQLSGRSFYICNDIECVSNVFKKLKIFKILRIEPDELLREKIHAVLDK